jgi:hypothetical protein
VTQTHTHTGAFRLVLHFPPLTPAGGAGRKSGQSRRKSIDTYTYTHSHREGKEEEEEAEEEEEGRNT